MSGSSTHMTPMLRQYHEIKRRYPGTILFFRLGDFYEMFFEDAVTGAKELEITLTARHKERGDPVPMCGVPYHAAGGYIARLVKKGFRVAICEQLEDPSAGTKLFRRDVVRVVTPGTTLESQLLESNRNNYLAALCGAGQGMGLALLDVSTGEFLATQFHGENAWRELQEQLDIFTPSEILYPRSLTPLISASQAATNAASGDSSNNTMGERVASEGATFTPLDDWLFGFDHTEGLLLTQFKVKSLDGFGLADRTFAVCASGAAIHYINETQRSPASHLGAMTYFEPNDYLSLDATTVANLELVSATDGRPGHSFLGVMDETKTGMGGRLLRQWVLRPSVSPGEIERRLEAVDELMRTSIKRDRICRQLETMADLERLTSKLILNRASARDLIALRESIEAIPRIKDELKGASCPLLIQIDEDLDPLGDVRETIANAIADDPPATTSDAGMIREGYNPELDELRSLAHSGKSYIAAIEARERGRTGIHSLKVRFNNVFGYFIEVSKANKDRVPADYDRKQTLVNAERYTTPELKEYETKVLGAEERILELEISIFNEVRSRIALEVRRILTVGHNLALLDVVASFAQLAAARKFVKPIIHEGDSIEILGGRHPVIETLGERFTPNDLTLNNTTDRLLILTGPNMGGKSVYLKQTALIVIMAQMGSFVPARSASIALTDRIFTRVGASDNLAKGRSTFLVEMIETANILNSATPRSLVLLDEVGRGTATFDGLSLAWAIAEYIHDDPHHAAKTLFATHYHEMTELAKMRPGVKNYQVAVSEAEGEIVFLRKVVPGAANKSYGIEVARLAGLPRGVLERAREILVNLEQNELDLTGKPKFARHLKKPSRFINQPSLLDLVDESEP